MDQDYPKVNKQSIKNMALLNNPPPPPLCLELIKPGALWSSKLKSLFLNFEISYLKRRRIFLTALRRFPMIKIHVQKPISLQLICCINQEMFKSSVRFGYIVGTSA